MPVSAPEREARWGYTAFESRMLKRYLWRKYDLDSP
jgi:hypothetical protein